MSKFTQKEAVFSAISNVLAENNQTISENEAVTLTKEQRAQVRAILFEGFSNGTIELSEGYDTDKKLNGYINGLMSNWVRKDKRLNGGIAYVAKNPGSRTGSGDASLTAMRKLLSTLTTDEDKAEVQNHIDARLAELQAAKVKSVVVDFSALPADLAAKFQK